MVVVEEKHASGIWTSTASVMGKKLSVVAVTPLLVVVVETPVLTGNGGVEGKGTLLASHSAICLSRLSAPPPIDNGLTSKMPANRSSSIVHGLLRTLGGEWPCPHNLEYLSKPENVGIYFLHFEKGNSTPIMSNHFTRELMTHHYTIHLE